jgi:hypothetical protein
VRVTLVAVLEPPGDATTCCSDIRDRVMRTWSRLRVLTKASLMPLLSELARA